MSERPLKVFFSAGEASGESHAAAALRALRRLHPSLEVRALGGSMLEAEGAVILQDLTQHAVMGVLSVIPRLRTFKRILDETVAALALDPPDVAVPVDFSGFNMRLARRLRELGIPVCYYVSPQIWASRPWRIHGIKKSIDHMMALFDFEIPLYKAHDVPVTFVGHPLFDTLSAERPQSNLRRDLGMTPAQSIVGLLPGSRVQEVRRILPELCDAARIIYEKHREIQFVVPVARSGLQSEVDRILDGHGRGLPIRVVAGRAHEVMAASRVALTASGTATLELAYYETPMVIVYKLSAFEKFFVPLLGIGFIGLVNIIAGKEICKEYLDSRDRSAEIGAEALALLRSGRRRKEVLSALRNVRQRVVVRGASANAAKCILDLALSRRKPG